MFATLIGTFFLHSKQRDAEREKRMQYWREQVSDLIDFCVIVLQSLEIQNAFRQNILQMRETARNSILSLGQLSGTASPRSSMLRGDGSSDDSHAPILQYGAGKLSGLR